MSTITLATFTAVINQLLPEPHAGLLSGILFGTKATLSRDLQQALIATGTLHIIALSGMNISILVSIVNTLLLRLISRRIASLLTIGVIIGFIAFVGVSPSVIRAAVMSIIALVAVMAGRQSWSLFSWLLAVVGMILLYPPWLGEVSFQLSALATLGIILFGKKKPSLMLDNRSPASPAGGSKLDFEVGKSKVDLASSFQSQNLTSSFQRLVSIVYSLIEDDLRITLAAQVFTIPISIFQFHRISFIAPVSNILIGWLISPIMVVGFVTTIAGWIWLPLGQVLAWFLWVPLQYVISVITITGRLPFASIAW